ncbi:protein of unknown function DUF58 [Leptothrix cholodnii SP-6]|uniref:DUF58 domain-containing protein n=2 Tax=Leptothrix cholodnii TaxID=34029 RepID=B1Y459_LEPCP|nr:protein of unknown function DUF58 [Leptothrix cholodnii SP-6]
MATSAARGGLEGTAPSSPTLPATARPGAAVTPGLAEALLRRLEWTVIRRLDGLLQGDCRTLLRGTGLDLADLREYQPHDDVRHIDWNVTARVGVPHVRQFQEDRDMTVVFLLDLSSSVNWGTVCPPPAECGGRPPMGIEPGLGRPGTGFDAAGPTDANRGVRTKQQVATELIAVLARLFTRSGHRVSALIYRQGGSSTEELPARGGRGQVLQLLTRITRPHRLSRTETVAPPLPVRGWLSGWFRGNRPAISRTDEATRLADLLQAAEHRLRRRCTVLVVSDFISQPGWQAPLGRLALRHDVLAVRLSDPSEHELPAAGLVLLRDAESGEELLVDTDDPALRARHAALAQAHERRVLDGLAGAGVDTLELGTAEPLLEALRRFLALRRLRRNQRAGAAPHRAGSAGPTTAQPARPETPR